MKLLKSFLIFFHISLSFSSIILPEKLIIGYGSWGECDNKIIQAVEDGVNIIIWFAINLLTNITTNKPLITGGPNRECVINIKNILKQRNLTTIHLISIGGWDAPHPDTTNTPEVVYQNWVEWNNGLYDGFDWDIEGNDDLTSPYNTFTQECLDLMGKMSQYGKKDGYIVSMAPAESYLDVTTSEFDYSLTHNYPEWETLQPNFFYHGRNVYSYLLLNYGQTIINSDIITTTTNNHNTNNNNKNTYSVPTFDFISIQLYESYTHAVYNVSILGTSPSDYLIQYVPLVLKGWKIQINSTSLLDLFISSSQLVIGLANGWADGSKSLLVWPEEAEVAYNTLKEKNLQPRGFMFWDIADEGRVVTGTDKEMWMAAGLNKFLHTR